MMEILASIDKKKPSSFDIYLPPLEILHKDFQVLRKSVEFSQPQVNTLTAVAGESRGNPSATV